MVEILETKTASKKRTARKRAAAKKPTAVPSPLQPLAHVKKHATTDNPYVGISRSVATAGIVMTGLVLIIAPSAVWILGPVIGAMAIFGIALGYFASK